METRIPLIIDRLFAELNGAVRYTVNENVIQEQPGTFTHYMFVAYKGYKQHLGEIIKGRFKGMSQMVDIEAYGVMVYRIVEAGGKIDVRQHDLGFLSSRNYETYSVINRLGRMEIAHLDQVVEFVQHESSEWEESFEIAARKELKRLNGLHNYNPLNFKGPGAIRSHYRGRGIDA